MRQYSSWGFAEGDEIVAGRHATRLLGGGGRRYRVTVEPLLPLALEPRSAPHYVHGRGVVHLDAKPRNVVMSDRPHLTDLSVAGRTDVVSGFTMAAPFVAGGGDTE